MVQRKKFSSQADIELINSMKEIAKKEGKQFQAVLEEAMRNYIEYKLNETPRENVLAHFRASVEKNRRLGELLAK